jgi:hypothetical protein
VLRLAWLATSAVSVDVTVVAVLASPVLTVPVSYRTANKAGIDITDNRADLQPPPRPGVQALESALCWRI